jgi:ribokinase
MWNNNLSEQYTLIIGSSNMDMFIYSDQLPRPGETVTGGTFEIHLGGKGANQAVAAARSGSTTFFIGKLGYDEYGDQMISQLNQEKIRTDYIIRTPNKPSGIAFIMVDKDGENMISVAPGANSTLNPLEIEERKELIAKASAIVVQMEIPTNTIEKIFQLASKGDAIKILNPAPLKRLPMKIFKDIDVLVPNEGELFRLHRLQNLGKLRGKNEEKIINASKDILNLGTKTVITTLGPKGCYIYNEKEEISKKLPAYEVKAVDSVGAGDCFNGVLASMITQKNPLLDSVKYAICAASIAVTRKGAQESIPLKKEIDERYLKYNKIYMIK